MVSALRRQIYWSPALPQNSSQTQDVVLLALLLAQHAVASGQFWGKALTSQVLQRRVVTGGTTDEAPCCPDCQRPGARLPDDEIRLLQTSRGEVAWSEADGYCRRCRRSFFPAVG